MRNADHGFVVDPDAFLAAIRTRGALHASVNRYEKRFIDAFEIERESRFFPAIRFFNLISVDDFLLEETVVVVDAVAEAGHAKRRHRFEEAGCKTAKSTITECCVGLGVQNVVELRTAFGDSAPRFFYEFEIVERVTERAPDEEFHGEIVKTFRGC